MNSSLSTGQIAQYCGVHLRTVIRWIEQGHLKGFKLPGRGNNRVLRREFIHFLTKQNMPIPDALLSNDKTVLIVDDNKQMADAISRVLRRNTWTTIHAADGFQAGLAMAKHDINLITLDLMMPNINGFDVLETLAGDEQLCKIPILIISASSDEHLTKALSMGASDYLKKPFDNATLLDVTNKLMAK